MSDDRPDPVFPEGWLKKPEEQGYAAADMSAEVTELMLAAKAGDGAAFDSLVIMLRSRAFQIAKSLVEYDLRRDAGIRTPQDRGYRLLTMYQAGTASRVLLTVLHGTRSKSCIAFQQLLHNRFRRIAHVLPSHAYDRYTL